MKVSVIVPVYNVENYLAECLESIINQSYENMEIICINDCSTDRSLEILKEYAQHDSRIVIMENEENRGQAYSRNLGLMRATGDYILFVDSDDTISLNLLDCCINVCNDKDMVCFDYKQMLDNNVDVRKNVYKMEAGEYGSHTFFAESMCKDSLIFAPWSKFYRRRFLIDEKIFFYNGIIYEDILFTFYCFLKAGKIYNLNQKLYKYRIREQSTMTSRITEKNIGSYFICICELMELYLKEEFDEETSSAVERYIQKAVREYISAYRQWDCEKKEISLLQDNPKYLKLYRTFSQLCVRSGKLLDISSEKIEEIRKYRYAILYGAGGIARSVIEILDGYDISLYGIAVTDGQKNKKSLLGNPIRELQAYESIKDQCTVLVGTTPKYALEIHEQLRKSGFINWIDIMES